MFNFKFYNMTVVNEGRKEMITFYMEYIRCFFSCAAAGKGGDKPRDIYDDDLDIKVPKSRDNFR